MVFGRQKDKRTPIKGAKAVAARTSSAKGRGTNSNNNNKTNRPTTLPPVVKTPPRRTTEASPLLATDPVRLEEGQATMAAPSTPPVVVRNNNPHRRLPATPRSVFSMSTTVQNRMASKNFKRDVSYEDSNHWQVIFQLHGSVWPKVLPWCLAVTAVTVLFIVLRRTHTLDLTIADPTGHTFMSILVSFLLVTRVTITHQRFMEARGHLEHLFGSARECVQLTCLLTSVGNSHAAAVEWRQEVAYRTIVCLRVVMAALEFRSTGVNTWDVLPEADRGVTPLFLSPSMREDGPPGDPSDMAAVLQSLAHGPRTALDENFRAPVVWIYHLRECLLRPRQPDSTILSGRDWHVNEALKLMATTSEFVTHFHGLKKLSVTPFPFPLIQLNRIFLLAWCFSLPLVLINDNDQSLEVLLLVFFTTFGFMGLEYVNMELDDPFGDDPNDFPSVRWAESVYEDIYISIYKTDGYASALALRNRITERIARGRSVEHLQDARAQARFRR
jgi:predicted membrane chloride channel (bestrophin family)